MISIFFIMAGTAVSGASAKADIATPRYTSIRIDAGQTLSDIAACHMDAGYDTLEEYIDDIVFINNLDSADEICAGQYLCLPYYDK